jgi:hypothetical protein
VFDATPSTTHLERIRRDKTIAEAALQTERIHLDHPARADSADLQERKDHDQIA